MSRNKHPALLKTKNFGLIIGGLFSVLFSLTGMYSGLYSNLESRLLDSYFSFKNVSDKTAVQKGAWHSNQDDTVSPDILIVGIDLKALQKFGTWPFPRSVHASFIDSFSRIQKQDEREKALFLDIFFIDDSGQPEADMELARSITESGNVYLESILDSSSFGESID
ncbi:MAG TPA: CHASE2 domain-containing protein, partial [Treponemataceae bacterium]|nr:CHASE2 domain-containing protein [Treponemataceae bacterium]